MKRIGKLVAIGLAAALTACSTAPTQVNHYQLTLPDFPTLLVTPTQVAPPPDPSTYLAGTWQEREQLLTTAYNQQTTNVMTCNIDKTNISSWWTQQQAVVAQTNAANNGAGTAPVSAPVAASSGQATQ